MKRLAASLCLLAFAPLHAAVDDSLAKLTSVGREGQGNEAASAAWKEVVKAGPSALPALLAASGKGNAVADNWLRLAGDAIVDGALREKKPLPLDRGRELPEGHRARRVRRGSWPSISCGRPTRRGRMRSSRR